MTREISPNAKQNELGYWFDPDGGWARDVTNSKKARKMGITCVLVLSPEKEALEYLLIKDNAIIDGDTSFEGACYKVDAYYYAKYMK